MLDLKYSLISYNFLDVCNKKLIIWHLTCVSCMWKYMSANAKQLTLSVFIWLGESSEIMYKIIPEYIWKTQIDVQSLKDFNRQIVFRFLRHIHMYLRSMSPFLIGAKFSNLCPFLYSQMYDNFSCSQIDVHKRHWSMP